MPNSITELIPREVLHRFLRSQMRCKVVLVAVSGAHAYGYPHPTSPLDLRGIHVEPTEALVGLAQPPHAYNWVGEFEGQRIDFSSLEVGAALKRLLRGDGSVLERILAPRQLLRSHDLERLQGLTRGVLSLRFHSHYRAFSRGVLREYQEDEQRSVSHLLGAYRTALTGVHLLRTAQVELDLMELAGRYGFANIEELVERNRQVEDAVLEKDSRWINRLVRMQGLIEESYDLSELPPDPERPNAVAEYLLDMRRRFFDAATIEDS